ncbi:MAG: lytic murein transglycosylase [Acidobacteria bacterium]|nr:lytic murein transglycosylase [Acidobacteriota bacterium]
MHVPCGLVLAALLVGAAGAPPQSPPPVLPVATPPPFAEWLLELRAEAISRGISADMLDRAFADLQPVEKILERDRTQAEFALDLDAYLKRRLTSSTVKLAQQMHARHRTLLNRVERAYGVSSRVVVSVWGLESNFGRFSGVRPTIPALVTLAYDPRRGPMFRNELFSALEIVDRGDIELERLKGSWAGALGQPQFMPSSYLEYAQDFDGDNRKDIWSSQADVFASIAFFLQKHGWTAGEAWGREISVPPLLQKAALTIPRREAGCRARRLMTDPRPLTEWHKMGLKTITNARLPKSTRPASMVEAGKRTFLLYDNYEALLGYNCAHSYALSVALLSDRLR